MKVVYHRMTFKIKIYIKDRKIKVSHLKHYKGIDGEGCMHEMGKNFQTCSWNFTVFPKFAGHNFQNVQRKDAVIFNRMSGEAQKVFGKPGFYMVELGAQGYIHRVKVCKKDRKEQKKTSSFFTKCQLCILEYEYLYENYAVHYIIGTGLIGFELGNYKEMIHEKGMVLKQVHCMQKSLLYKLQIYIHT